jgi:hypothetical protein
MLEAPNSKHQAPEKLQTPIKAWAFLNFGAWDFSGAWCLEFGAFNRQNPQAKLGCQRFDDPSTDSAWRGLTAEISLNSLSRIQSD